MAKITYGSICSGKTLQVGDTLIIHGVSYKVCDDGIGAYYLHETNGNNARVFEVLHITQQEKIKWAERFGSRGIGIFPEFPTLKDLTAFTKEVYEKSPYKVGDIVRVKKLAESESTQDYPFSFTRSMSERYGGILMKILIISKSTLFEDCRYHRGDPHQYQLCDLETGVNSSWNWHSSMFEMVEVQANDKKQTNRGSDYDIDKPKPNQEEKIVVNEPRRSIKTTIIL